MQIQDMKRLSDFIIESASHFLVSKKAIDDGYNYKPKTKDELVDIIEHLLQERGTKCDLNCIDTSEITDMAALFSKYMKPIFNDFNGDISEWNVSNVTNMYSMFMGSKFNGDISKWDVSNVTEMSSMFNESEFNGDISGWNVSNVKDMAGMFFRSEFSGDISEWDVSNVKSMYSMFMGSKFNSDISKWDVSNVGLHDRAFKGCPLEKQPEKQCKFKS